MGKSEVSSKIGELEKVESRAKRDAESFGPHFENAVKAIAHIARWDPDSNARLRAATYIVERVVGKVPTVTRYGEEDPWSSLIEEITRETVACEQEKANAGDSKG